MKPVKGLAMAALFGLSLMAAPAYAQDQASKSDDKELNLRAYIELIRADVKAQRVGIITQIMQFDDAQAAKFWPIFREYDFELSKIGDVRAQLIQDYANNFDNMTNEKADELASKALDLETQRAELKKKYYDKMKKELTPIVAARFFQVENQMQHIIDLQISSSLPVVQQASN